MIIKEACLENFEYVAKAIQNGASRIELCDNLAVGGTTVSHGVMQETITYCSEKKVPVMAIIRPRGGNFIYNDLELKIMEADLFEAKKLGADGVVIGCLTEQDELDEEAMLSLIDIADGMQITFHMAFDSITKEKQLATIDWLVANGIHRILTHGGSSEKPITENLPYLKDLIAYANGRITILPGGGINHTNYQTIVDYLNIKEVHGTKIVGDLTN